MTENEQAGAPASVPEFQWSRPNVIQLPWGAAAATVDETPLLGDQYTDENSFGLLFVNAASGEAVMTHSYLRDGIGAAHAPVIRAFMSRFLQQIGKTDEQLEQDIKLATKFENPKYRSRTDLFALMRQLNADNRLTVRVMSPDEPSVHTVLEGHNVLFPSLGLTIVPPAIAGIPKRWAAVYRPKERRLFLKAGQSVRPYDLPPSVHTP